MFFSVLEKEPNNAIVRDLLAVLKQREAMEAKANGTDEEETGSEDTEDDDEEEDEEDDESDENENEEEEEEEEEEEVEEDFNNDAKERDAK
jgi:hypothetical protein